MIRLRAAKRAVAAALSGVVLLFVARDTDATTCTLKAVQTLNFGSYNPQSSSDDQSSSTITYNCSSISNGDVVYLTASGGASGNPSSRNYSGAALSYQMYTSSSQSTYWGNTPGNYLVVTASTGDNSATVYGAMPHGQSPSNGSYSDNVTVQLASFFSGVLDTSTQNVTCTVGPICTVSVASNLAFGAYDPIVVNQSTPLDAAASINVTCTSWAVFTVTLDQGLHPAAGSTDAAPLRQMAAGASDMSYAVYSDAGRTTTWGNTSATGVSGIGTGGSQSYTLYGRVASGQTTLPAASYADTLLVTVTY